MIFKINNNVENVCLNAKHVINKINAFIVNLIHFEMIVILNALVWMDII